MNTIEKQPPMKSVVSKLQLAAVTLLTLGALAAGILLAAIFGNFHMSPKDMQSQGSFTADMGSGTQME